MARLYMNAPKGLSPKQLLDELDADAGDLVVFGGDVGYRGENLRFFYVNDGDVQIIEPSYEIDDYGAVPPEFKYPEYPSDYWGSDEISVIEDGSETFQRLSLFHCLYPPMEVYPGMFKNLKWSHKYDPGEEEDVYYAVFAGRLFISHADCLLKGGKPAPVRFVTRFNKMT